MLEVIGCGCHMLPLPNLGVFTERLQTRFQGNIFSPSMIETGHSGPSGFLSSFRLQTPSRRLGPLGWHRSGQGKNGKVKTKTAWNLGSFFWKSIARLQNIPKFKDNPLDFTRHFLANCSGPVQCLSTLASKSFIR